MKPRWLILGLVAVAACGTPPATEPAVSPAPMTARQTSTPAEADSLFAAGQRAFSEGDWEDAITNLERFLLEAPLGDSRSGRARFYIAEAQFATDNHLVAAREFRRISDETPNDPLAPAALLRVADVYADLWRRPELDPSYGQTALATYQELLNRYPESEAAARAEVRIQELRDQFAVKQYKAALYYYRLKAYDSAILYLRDLIATYPRAEVAPEALLTLVEAYRTLGYVEDMRETCDYLRRFHPQAAGLDASCGTTTAGADTAS